ncbi:PREDICTED: THAP domain-containing protein 1-like isoform X4 [Acromyrmex echinatior]|uniref:THAP domain-containing protein 1-like isoform X4 n=1 Tax=Acromyrmex echinatior TaxID=103372 RepID=UPI000580CA5A|nr:PREDICTED: THAP domain-containing protein 1-like isoform X4 [Acromyrmex echinatior]
MLSKRPALAIDVVEGSFKTLQPKKDHQKKKHLLYIFPQIESIAAKWIEATGRKKFIPNKYSAICDIHFKLEDFSNTTRRVRLKPDVVPTKNLINCTSTERVKTIISEVRKQISSNEKEIEIKFILKLEEDETNTSETLKRNDVLTFQEMKMKIQKLEKKNEELINKLQSLQINLEEKIQVQANVSEKKLQCQTARLKCIVEEQRKKFKRKLVTKEKQLKILRIAVRRKNNHIKNLLDIVKIKKILTKTSYNTLKHDFGESSFLVKNETQNQNKSSHRSILIVDSYILDHLKCNPKIS